MTLLERRGSRSQHLRVVGGLVLLAGIITRPLGGWVVRRAPGLAWPLVALSLVAGPRALVLVLSAAPPFWLAALASLLVGLAAGFPFAAVFDTTQRLRPDAPAAAVGFVNGCAVLAIVVCTPLAGLAFDLPGDGRLAFRRHRPPWAAPLLVLRRAANT